MWQSPFDRKYLKRFYGPYTTIHPMWTVNVSNQLDSEKSEFAKNFLLQNYKGPHILSLECHYGLHTALTGLVYLDGDKKGTKEEVKLSESQQSFSFS